MPWDGQTDPYTHTKATFCSYAHIRPKPATCLRAPVFLFQCLVFGAVGIQATSQGGITPGKCKSDTHIGA